MLSSISDDADAVTVEVDVALVWEAVEDDKLDSLVVELV